jgi:hypothetical protein
MNARSKLIKFGKLKILEVLCSSMIRILISGLVRDYFVAQFGHLLDPNDNSFHASFKRRYWNLVDRKNSMSMLDQMKALSSAYFSEPEASIRGYFEQCGIVGDRPPADIIDDLSISCLYPTYRYLPIHIKQLSSYVEWRWKGKKTIREVIGDEFKFKFPQK